MNITKIQPKAHASMPHYESDIKLESDNQLTKDLHQRVYTLEQRWSLVSNVAQRQSLELEILRRNMRELAKI